LTLPRHPQSSEAVRADRAVHRVFARAPQRVAVPRTVLFAQGARRDEAILIQHGWAISVRTLPDGRRTIPELHLPGDIVGLEVVLRARADHALQALTPLVYHALGRDELAALAGTLALPLLDVAVRRYEGVRDLAELIARGSAEERLATFLLSLYERLRRRHLAVGASFRMPMTQQEIGDHLGITVVHVNRVMQRLVQQGIVARAHQRILVLQDPERLAAIARHAAAAAPPARSHAGGTAAIEVAR
jgi:CRP/FNR family transcriptional regulator